jgi:murein DD-endopeptidase MepM/ murein hydrolase activator NlpD
MIEPTCFLWPVDRDAWRLTQDVHIGHVAIDLATPIGTQVHSMMSGRVKTAGAVKNGYGNLVIVEAGRYKCYTAHLSEIGVEVGQIVQAGQYLGKTGNSGNSTGPHIHIEVRRNDRPIDFRGMMCAIEPVVVTLPLVVQPGQPQPASEPADQLYRVRREVRVRSAPTVSDDGNILGLLPVGLQVQVEAVLQDSSGSWAKLGPGLYSAIRHSDLVYLEPAEE